MTSITITSCLIKGDNNQKLSIDTLDYLQHNFQFSDKSFKLEPITPMKISGPKMETKIVYLRRSMYVDNGVAILPDKNCVSAQFFNPLIVSIPVNTPVDLIFKRMVARYDSVKIKFSEREMACIDKIKIHYAGRFAPTKQSNEPINSISYVCRYYSGRFIYLHTIERQDKTVSWVLSSNSRPCITEESNYKNKDIPYPNTVAFLKASLVKNYPHLDVEKFYKALTESPGAEKKTFVFVVSAKTQLPTANEDQVYGHCIGEWTLDKELVPISGPAEAFLKGCEDTLHIPTEPVGDETMFIVCANHEQYIAVSKQYAEIEKLVSGKNIYTAISIAWIRGKLTGDMTTYNTLIEAYQPLDNLHERIIEMIDEFNYGVECLLNVESERKFPLLIKGKEVGDIMNDPRVEEFVRLINLGASKLPIEDQTSRTKTKPCSKGSERQASPPIKEFRMAAEIAQKHCLLPYMAINDKSGSIFSNIRSYGSQKIATMESYIREITPQLDLLGGHPIFEGDTEFFNDLQLDGTLSDSETVEQLFGGDAVNATTEPGQVSELATPDERFIISSEGDELFDTDDLRIENRHILEVIDRDSPLLKVEQYAYYLPNLNTPSSTAPSTPILSAIPSPIPVF